MKKILFFLSVALIFGACSQKAETSQKRHLAGSLTKGAISKITPSKNGYMLEVLIKNGKQYTSARGFVPSLNTKNEQGETQIYEEGDLLLMKVENGVIVYNEISIKNFTTREGATVRSSYKRDKSKITAPVPSENSLSF